MIRKIRRTTGFILLLGMITALLGVVCISADEYPAGETIRQITWILYGSAAFLGAIWLMFLICPRDIYFYDCSERFEGFFFLLFLVSLPILLLGTTENEHVALCAICLLVFSLLRLAFGIFPALVHCVCGVILGFGVFEAVLGLKQVYGFAASNHSMFTLTGTFFNPGPYSGFLAICIAMGVGLYGTMKNRWLRYILCVALALMICLLPAGMSRSAWLAAIVGSAVAWYLHSDIRQRIRTWWNTHTRLRLVIPIATLVATISLLGGMYFLKQDSANGRLFIWKITTRMIAERPLLGYRFAPFSAEYGKAQEAYFASGQGSEWEKQVAGTPEYAFNEYLQLAYNVGIPMALVFLLFCGWCIYQGILYRRIAAVAGLVAYGVFAFSAYPAQLPFMLLLFFVLLACCVSPPHNMSIYTSFTRRDNFVVYGIYALSLLLVIVLPFVTIDYNQTQSAGNKWRTAHLFYSSKSFEVAAREYEPLYSGLKTRPAYLFEYGMAMRHLKKYDKSTELLQRASQYSGDPMILNIIARNYEDFAVEQHKLGWEGVSERCFSKSEQYLWQSAHRLPNRIYPYYLLARLYSNPHYSHPHKAREMAHIVLTQKEKIPSPAIRQMRAEMKKLLNNEPLTPLEP